MCRGRQRRERGGEQRRQAGPGGCRCVGLCAVGQVLRGRAETTEQRPGHEGMMIHVKDPELYSESSGEQWKYVKLKTTHFFKLKKYLSY